MNKWKVNDYKNLHESEEHWKLRKAFMQQYKESIPEDELVCLAQTMINIEFLGCRYSKEVMLRIEELAADLLKDSRSQRKDRLKRTFVGASDAATAKIKRSSLSDTLKRPAEPAPESLEPAVKKRISEELFYINYEPTDFISDFGKIVIYDPSTADIEQSATTIVQIINGKCKAMVEEQLDVAKDTFRVSITINGRIAGTALAATKVLARKEAYDAALSELRKHYYTLKVKNSFLARDNQQISKFDEECDKRATTEKIGENNLGFKLLKSLGWKGGGLGSKNDGIVNPVELSVNIGRQGLGATTNTDYYRNILRKYKNTPTLYDLVFTNEFANEERAVLHQLAKRLDLKSKSYGKNENRHLVISKKITIFDIAADMIEKKDPVKLPRALDKHY
uniref:Uncharacterized protein n=1 Tax=Phlebotomus papatasi TaxID=29031 RepID=A0A1B0DCU7_PHLPP